MYQDKLVPVIDFEVNDKLGVPQYMLDYSKQQSRKNYKQRMEEEGLLHKDQDYMNILATPGDTWRYLPGVVAWTLPGLHATFSHKELEPYGIKARPHEGGHSVLAREIGPHSEHQVDQLIDDPSRNYKLDSVRFSY